MEIYILVSFTMAGDMDQVYSNFKMVNIILDISTRTYFMEKGCIYGINKSISLAVLNQDRKHGVDLRDRSNIKEVSRITEGMAKEHVGIQVDRYIQDNG